MMKDYDAYIFLVHEGKKDLNKLEQFLKIKLNKKIQNEFEGKVNQNVNMYVQSQGKVYHIILGGLGKKEKDNNIFSEVLRKKTGKIKISNKNILWYDTRIIIHCTETENNKLEASLEKDKRVESASAAICRPSMADLKKSIWFHKKGLTSKDVDDIALKVH